MQRRIQKCAKERFRTLNVLNTSKVKFPMRREIKILNQIRVQTSYLFPKFADRDLENFTMFRRLGSKWKYFDGNK